MTIYEEGYSHYVAQCEQYGLKPLSLRYFIKHLSKKQLEAFNAAAQCQRA